MAEPSVEFVTNNSEIMSGSNGATAEEEEILKEVLLRRDEGSGDSGYEKDTAGVEGVEVLEQLGQEGVKLKDQEEEKSQQQHAMDHDAKNSEGKMMSMQHTNNAARDDDNELCSSAPDHIDELSSPPECRICSFEAEPDRPLFYPCACSGTIRWVHQDCLEQWLKVKNLSTERCEVCGVAFHFTPIYKEGTPSCLAPSEFIRGVLTRAKRPISFALHISYAFILWGGVLPFFTLAISRIYFCSSIQSAATVIHSMTHSNLHELLCHIGVGTGLCIMIMVVISIFPSAIVNWLMSVLHLITVLVRPIIYTGLAVLYIWKKRRIRRWMMMNVMAGDTTSERRRGRSHHYCSSSDVLLRENKTYNHDDIVYDCVAGILFVGRKGHTLPEDGEKEEEEIAAPLAPLNDVIVNHVNAMNPPTGIFIPGIGFVNLNIVLGIIWQIASPILTPLLPLMSTIVFVVVFLAFFQFVPFKVGYAVLEPWNTLRSAANTISDSCSADNGEVFSRTQHQYPSQNNLWKLVIDKFLGILSYSEIEQEPSSSSYLSQFFSCKWLGRDMIKTSAAVTEREKISLLELSNKFCTVGLGYALMFGVTVILLFTFLILFAIKERVIRFLRETDSGEEEERFRTVRAVLYSRLLLLCQQILRFLKVSLFLLIDAILLPLWVGIIMDFFTLQTLQSTVEDRWILLKSSPVLFVFCHWFVGIIYNVGVHTTLIEVRKVLSTEWLRDWLPRPEQLENPEMGLVMLANMPFVQHLQRTMLGFGRIVPILFLSLYLPLQASRFLPGVSKSLELKLSEAYVEVQLPMELLFLHVIFPMAIDKINIRQTVRTLVSWFFISTCQALELDEVLIDADTLHVWREEHQQNEQPQQGQQQHREQQQRHRAQDGEVVVLEDEERQPLLVEESVAANEQQLPSLPHDRGSPSPNHLRLRLLLLGVTSCIWLTVACFIGIHLPLFMGRGLFLLVDIPVVSDWHTVVVGFIVSWGLISGFQYFYNHVVTQLGTISFVKSMRIWLVVGMKWLVLSVLWLIMAPLLIGSVFEAVLITPVFYPLAETPRTIFAQDWALGLVALKLWMQYTIIGAVGRGGRQIERGGRRGGGGVMGRQVVPHPRHGGHPHHDPPSLTWADRLEKVFNCGVRGTLRAPALLSIIIHHYITLFDVV